MRNAAAVAWKVLHISLRQRNMRSMSWKRESERGWKDDTSGNGHTFAGMGIPLAYHHFAEGESPDPPFLLYLSPGSDNFAADGIAYFKVTQVDIELYTDEKSPDTEAQLEALLDGAGLFYDKTESYIESEKLYEVLYELEV